ncbi:hypothetical protein IM660_07575 [Ruania alkalisoli]|uniref:DUF4439 domain-containing protein n=1 Tax=Ruania alkalisoli TaxID=2779775 RepID=A0A7M1SWY6_9MICO|nr:hypothetical protein [Ruania alkalisoli]QOR72088.1 hypothetical protein IM660_07575 [Ruania alkalisoli]
MDRHIPGPASGRRRRTSRLTLWLTAVLVLLSGCAIRLDGPPDPVPSPDAAEQVRQHAAIASAQLAELADATSAPGEEIAALLAGIGTTAQAQLDALGGVWRAPARPDDPSPSVPGLDVPGDTRPADVLSALVDSAAAARDAVALPAVDEDLAALLSGIVLQREAAASALAEMLDVDPGLADPEPRLPTTLTEAAAGLCRTLDALAYAGETIAARSTGDARARAAAQAISDRDLAEQIAVAAGLDGTSDDPREVSYAVGDLQADMTSWRADLVPGWLAQIPAADPADRMGLLDHARAAARVAPPDPSQAFPGQG